MLDSGGMIFRYPFCDYFYKVCLCFDKITLVVIFFHCEFKSVVILVNLKIFHSSYARKLMSCVSAVMFLGSIVGLRASFLKLNIWFAIISLAMNDNEVTETFYVRVIRGLPMVISLWFPKMHRFFLDWENLLNSYAFFIIGKIFFQCGRKLHGAESC